MYSSIDFGMNTTCLSIHLSPSQTLGWLLIFAYLMLSDWAVHTLPGMGGNVNRTQELCIYLSLPTAIRKLQWRYVNFRKSRCQ